MSKHTDEPMVLGHSALACEICVPQRWLDEQILAFGNSRVNPYPIESWQIAGRAGCDHREGYIHVALNIPIPAGTRIAMSS